MNELMLLYIIYLNHELHQIKLILDAPGDLDVSPFSFGGFEKVTCFCMVGI